MDRCSNTIQLHTVWLDKKEKIASFHPLDNCEHNSFTDHAEFISYLMSLQLSGYRFQ